MTTADVVDVTTSVGRPCRSGRPVRRRREAGEVGLDRPAGGMVRRNGPVEQPERSQEQPARIGPGAPVRRRTVARLFSDAARAGERGPTVSSLIAIASRYAASASSQPAAALGDRHRGSSGRPRPLDPGRVAIGGAAGPRGEAAPPRRPGRVGRGSRRGRSGRDRSRDGRRRAFGHGAQPTPSRMAPLGLPALCVNEAAKVVEQRRPIRASSASPAPSSSASTCAYRTGCLLESAGELQDDAEVVEDAGGLDRAPAIDGRCGESATQDPLRGSVAAGCSEGAAQGSERAWLGLAAFEVICDPGRRRDGPMRLPNGRSGIDGRLACRDADVHRRDGIGCRVLLAGVDCPGDKARRPGSITRGPSRSRRGPRAIGRGGPDASDRRPWHRRRLDSEPGPPLRHSASPPARPARGGWPRGSVRRRRDRPAGSGGPSVLAQHATRGQDDDQGHDVDVGQRAPQDRARPPGQPAVYGAAGEGREELGLGLRQVGEREREERDDQPDRPDDPRERRASGSRDTGTRSRRGPSCSWTRSDGSGSIDGA